MRVYVDTMVWIYALEGNPDFGLSAQKLLARISAGRHTTLTSHFLPAELLVPHVRRRDMFTVARYRHMILNSAAFEVIPFGTEAALSFAMIRSIYRVKQPDAIHLALAASAQADAFVTIDDRLQKLAVSGIDAIGDLDFDPQ